MAGFGYSSVKDETNLVDPPRNCIPPCNSTAYRNEREASQHFSGRKTSDIVIVQDLLFHPGSSTSKLPCLFNDAL
jgi:hypothetical protein